MTAAAIAIKGVTKQFKKQALRKHHSTLKTELIRFFKPKSKRALEPEQNIVALRGVDLEIPKGATAGIIGRNGSGKSTLLKLITGIYSPTSGQVKVNGRISALLDLGAGFHPDFTGRENITINGIILGMSRAEVKARMQTIIEFAELGDFIDEPVRTYSSGMFMRLAFAVATHVDPDILIIDEILAVGDEHFQRKSRAKMEEFKASGRTIVLVTHDLSTVERWCDCAAWLDGGTTRMFGEPSKVVAEYRRAVTLAEEEIVRTGSSALSVPGLALPQAQVTTLELKLVDGSGSEVVSLASGAPLGVRVGWTGVLSGPLAIELCVSGAVLFAVEKAVDGSSVELTFEALPLAAGSYQVRARAGGAQVETALAVTGAVGGPGPVKLPHRWSSDVAKLAKPMRVG